jgi:hypothetical protein
MMRMGMIILLVLIWVKIIILRGEAAGDTTELFFHHHRQLLHLPMGCLAGDNAKGKESGVRLYKVERRGDRGRGQDHRAARLHLRLSLLRQMLPRYQTVRSQVEGKGLLLLRQRLLDPSLVAAL